MIIKNVSFEFMVICSLFLAVICDQTTPPTTPVRSTNGYSNKSADSSFNGDVDNEREKNYLIKFLSPYTVYPIRLKDHYGHNSHHTRWYKYGCRCYVDELDNSSAHFSTEIDQYDDGQTTVHLLLLNFNVISSSFLLDHYEPKHSKSRPKNESDLDYQYSYDEVDTNIQSEIYTLVYLNQFNLVKNNEAADSTELSCKVSLLLPSGIVDEQSQVLNEKLNEKLALKFNLHEPNDHVYSTTSGVGKSKRSIRLVPGRQRRRDKRQATGTKPSLYEIEIIEGPIKLFKSNFKDGLNASCSLSLSDFDQTLAFNSFINSTIFASSQRISADSSVPVSSSSSFSRRLSSSVFWYAAQQMVCFSILWLLTLERRS